MARGERGGEWERGERVEKKAEGTGAEGRRQEANGGLGKTERKDARTEGRDEKGEGMGKAEEEAEGGARVRVSKEK